MPGVLDWLQAYLKPVADGGQWPAGNAVAPGAEWQAPPGFWDAIMKPPTDLPLAPGQARDLSGGDRVFQPGGTIGPRLGLNEAGIYGRDVPMGNQDTVLPPALPQVPAMPRRSAGIDPNALPLILRRVLAADPQLGGALNQMMPRGGWM
jgi:hypothetical protein